jgi:hypothetical protein
VIEQAKDIVISIRSCGAGETFDALRETSRNVNVKLHDVAIVIVVAGSRTEPFLSALIWLGRFGARPVTLLRPGRPVDQLPLHCSSRQGVHQLASPVLVGQSD